MVALIGRRCHSLVSPEWQASLDGRGPGGEGPDQDQGPPLRRSPVIVYRAAIVRIAVAGRVVAVARSTALVRPAAIARTGLASPVVGVRVVAVPVPGAESVASRTTVRQVVGRRKGCRPGPRDPHTAAGNSSSIRTPRWPDAFVGDHASGIRSIGRHRPARNPSTSCRVTTPAGLPSIRTMAPSASANARMSDPIDSPPPIVGSGAAI
jgi:hypothetical protein